MERVTFECIVWSCAQIDWYIESAERSQLNIENRLSSKHEPDCMCVTFTTPPTKRYIYFNYIFPFFSKQKFVVIENHHRTLTLQSALQSRLFTITHKHPILPQIINDMNENSSNENKS